MYCFVAAAFVCSAVSTAHLRQMYALSHSGVVSELGAHLHKQLPCGFSPCGIFVGLTDISESLVDAPVNNLVKQMISLLAHGLNTPGGPLLPHNRTKFTSKTRLQLCAPFEARRAQIFVSVQTAGVRTRVQPCMLPLQLAGLGVMLSLVLQA